MARNKKKAPKKTLREVYHERGFDFNPDWNEPAKAPVKPEKAPPAKKD